MRARNLFIYSILYLILISLIVLFFFSDLLNNKHLVHIDFFSLYKKDIELANWLWLGLALVCYMVFALIYYYFSFIQVYFYKKRLHKDSIKFESFLEDLVLEKKPNYVFKTEELRSSSELVKTLYYGQSGSSFDKLSNALSLKAMIENGQVCDLKAFRLAKDNILNVKNEINRAKTDLNYAFNLIKNKTDITDEISLAAYENLIKNGLYSNIKILKIKKSKEDIKTLVNRFINDDFSLTNAELEVLISSSDFSENEYLSIAKQLFNKIEPISLKAIFEKLKNSNENTLKAYLYILARHSMYDELLNEIHSSEKKFEDFELLIFLKEQGKSYDVNKLIY